MKDILYTLAMGALAAFICSLFTGTVTKHDLFLCWMFAVLYCKINFE